MKRLGRVLGGLLAVALTVFSLQAFAAAQTGGRDFNHMTTGFPLSGGHAIAACETCHTGGVFKGTPRNCDGCHATGKRIVATPKSTSHIVTDAPCENCHFNSATWLGARFNHGAAKAGACATCHNGRIATGKNLGHTVTSSSCDQCHRSTAWSPASWNHTDTVSDCVVCHKTGGPGRNFTTHTAEHLQYTNMGINNCKACHLSYFSFPSVYYSHAGASSACETCHQNPTYTQAALQLTSTATHARFTTAGITGCQTCHKSYSRGSFSSGRYNHSSPAACATCHLDNQPKPMGGKPIGHVATTDACNQCHFSTTSWSPALGAKPTNHIPYNDGTLCSNCHTGLAKVNATTLHNFSLTKYPACTTCHLKNNAYTGWGQDTKSIGHEGWKSGDCSQSGCHKPLGKRGVLYSTWD
jgi:protein-arginine kinase activator protein McsA